MGSRGLALTVAALAATLVGCGGEAPLPAEAPQNASTEAAAPAAEGAEDQATGDVVAEDF